MFAKIHQLPYRAGQFPRNKNSLCTTVAMRTSLQHSKGLARSIIAVNRTTAPPVCVLARKTHARTAATIAGPDGLDKKGSRSAFSASQVCLVHGCSPPHMLFCCLQQGLNFSPRKFADRYSCCSRACFRNPEPDAVDRFPLTDFAFDAANGISAILHTAFHDRGTRDTMAQVSACPPNHGPDFASFNLL